MEPQFSPALLAEHRHRLFLSYRDLAVRAGCAHESISKWEKGLYSPRPASIRRLAEALGISPLDLCEITGEPASDWTPGPVVPQESAA
ncbi:helix-turn-helix domain-containing protein [Streptomyces sp. NPDC056401]|uniref:helix-turn-helix domain-containing protein n=1 Tax=Streptomyces sp. NPDC056401 TaxID=3345809 RepID=UPI0035DB367D